MEYLPPLLVSYILLLFGATLAATHAPNNPTHTHYYQPSTSFIRLAGARKGDNAFGIRDVKTYLHRFGYMKDPKIGINKEVDDQFDKRLERALLTYQDFFKLNKTGVLDQDTIAMMSKPRCGVPDILHDMGKYVSSKHFKRHYQFIPTRLRRYKSYVYYEIDKSVPPRFMYSIHQAFADWEPYVPLMFLRTFDHELDIRAEFVKREHNCTSAFDGPRGVAAHADVGAGSIFHFDEEENWQVGAVADGIDIRSVARHEIGHLLGLEHSSDKNAIMYPTNPRAGMVMEIGDDDKAGIKALYYG